MRLHRIASIPADGIGPDKSQVIPRNADNTLGTPTSLVRDAHAAGLKVIPYTFRAENQFLPALDHAGLQRPCDHGAEALHDESAVNRQARQRRE